MLALCLMLLGTYYAQNYAGIIGRSLALSDQMVFNKIYKLTFLARNSLHSIYLSLPKVTSCNVFKQ